MHRVGVEQRRSRGEWRWGGGGIKLQLLIGTKRKIKKELLHILENSLSEVGADLDFLSVGDVSGGSAGGTHTQNINKWMSIIKTYE